MKDEMRDMDFGAEETRALEAVRSLPRPEADPAFRQRLRENFATGSITGDPAPRETVRRGAPAPLPRWRRLAPLAVAAAAVVLLLVPYARQTGLDLVSVEGANQIVLNGELVSCDDLSPIQAALQWGCRIEVPDGATVELARSGQLVMDLEGVEFTFPRRPLPLIGGGMSSSVEGDGTVRIATAPGAAGQAFRLQVGDANLVIRDSVFTVSQSGGEVGINVLEGELEAILPDGRSETLGPLI
jgi:ferric-dicitrate binding protein FerR (iron transport regulator)